MTMILGKHAPKIRRSKKRRPRHSTLFFQLSSAFIFFGWIVGMVFVFLRATNTQIESKSNINRNRLVDNQSSGAELSQSQKQNKKPSLLSPERIEEMAITLEKKIALSLSGKNLYSQSKNQISTTDNQQGGAQVGLLGNNNVDHLSMYESPLLMITCKRANYLAESLENVFKHMPQNSCMMGCPIVISQDGYNEDVTNVIRTYQSKFETIGIPVFHIQHDNTKLLRANQDPYHMLASHYGWALDKLFSGDAYQIGTNTTKEEEQKDQPNSNDKKSLPSPKRVIILEEDLRVAVDFFEYFMVTSKLLEVDTTLLAISAFNDNGFANNVLESKRLLRSDFFSGLGWMITANVWNTEFGSKWPNGYWDDWLREPAQRKNRQFIHPEISRTFHFGFENGASGNQFGDTFLARVKLNDEKVNWRNEDLSYLLPKQYYTQYKHVIKHATVIQRSTNDADMVDNALSEVKNKNVRIEYNNIEQFKKYAALLKIMDDEKAGIPRTAYQGVVEIRPYGQYLLLLTPPIDQIKFQ